VNTRVLRVAAVIEASTVTGPAKNLIEFCITAKTPDSSAPELPVIEPLVITYVRDSTAKNTFLKALEISSIKSQIVEERFRFDPGVISRLCERIKDFRPDVLQSHNVKSHFLIRIAGLHRQYPWIGFHHGYTSTDRKMELYNTLDRWSLPHARHVVTVSEPFARQLIRRGVTPARITVLHNSVRPVGEPDPAAIRMVRQKLGLREREAVILSVGRLSREKAHSDLIEAVALLRRISDRPFRVVLLGDGPERTNLSAKIESLGLQESVLIAGHVADVSPFYASASIMALPSHSEGSPNVVLEAMAHGVPIAATAVGGIPEILSHNESGLLVPPKDPKAMAQALARLLEEKILRERLSLAGQNRSRDFTPAAYRRSISNVYFKVLRESSHPAESFSFV